MANSKRILVFNSKPLAKFNVMRFNKLNKYISLFTVLLVLLPMIVGTTIVPNPNEIIVTGSVERTSDHLDEIFVAILGKGRECGTKTFSPLSYEEWGGQGEANPVSSIQDVDGTYFFEVSATSWCTPDSVSVVFFSPSRGVILGDPISIREMKIDSVFSEPRRMPELVGCGLYKAGEPASYFDHINRSIDIDSISIDM